MFQHPIFCVPPSYHHLTVLLLNTFYLSIWNNRYGDIPVIIKFVGQTDFNKKGTWVGVSLRTPTAKHGGVVDGRRYFSCKPKHGMFVRCGRLTKNYVIPPTGKDMAPPERQRQESTAPVFVPACAGPRLTTKKTRKSVPEKDVASQSKASGLEKKPMRYYTDSQGEKVLTTKSLDPLGNPTFVCPPSPSKRRKARVAAERAGAAAKEEYWERRARHKACNYRRFPLPYINTLVYTTVPC